MGRLWCSVHWHDINLCKSKIERRPILSNKMGGRITRREYGNDVELHGGNVEFSMNSVSNENPFQWCNFSFFRGYYNFVQTGT